MHILSIIFVFLFVDLFDNIGTLVAVTERAGLIAQSMGLSAETTAGGIELITSDEGSWTQPRCQAAR